MTIENNNGALVSTFGGVLLIPGIFLLLKVPPLTFGATHNVYMTFKAELKHFWPILYKQLPEALVTYEEQFRSYLQYRTSNKPLRDVTRCRGKLLRY